MKILLPNKSDHLVNLDGIHLCFYVAVLLNVRSMGVNKLYYNVWIDVWIDHLSGCIQEKSKASGFVALCYLTMH